MRLPVYMDCPATTPVAPRVLEAMLPYFREHFGNPASRTHSFGWVEQPAVDATRTQVAPLLGGEGRELVLTSRPTESNALALRGAKYPMTKLPDFLILFLKAAFPIPLKMENPFTMSTLNCRPKSLKLEYI